MQYIDAMNSMQKMCKIKYIILESSNHKTNFYFNPISLTIFYKNLHLYKYK